MGIQEILPNTFIYESILMKIYMNANIMNTQIFHFIRSQKVTFIFVLVTFNLNLRSYGQLFVLVFLELGAFLDK